MNIFYLDNDPKQAAMWLVDKHVIKMILESAQMLSTAHRLLDGTQEIIISNNRKKKYYKLHDERESIVYGATHINHPSNIWCRTSVENYLWLVEHLMYIGQEYQARYGKVHFCFSSGLFYYLQSPPYNLKKFDFTPIPCAMDKKYIISDDPVINYRNYYKFGKAHLHSWKIKERKPYWMGDIN